MACLLFLFFLTLPVPFPDQVQDAYAQRDADRLRALLAEADSRADSLLVRYRLYPLSENADLLTPLPKKLDDGSAREWALLSGLWSYRAGEASLFSAVTYGRRSANLLETAQTLDADDPYVLLIGGQSLLFRPAIAGKDAAAAAERFSRLADLAEQGRTAGIPPIEARVWKWVALREDGQDAAAASLYDRLRAQAPAPLYAQFLDDPPDV
jgi:hypothetical protein